MKKIDLKYLIIFLALAGLVLSVPSIVYLIFHGNLDNYNGQNYYFLDTNSNNYTIAGVIIFALIVILSFAFYFLILEKSDEFKNIKAILWAVFLIGLMFMICLPNTSTDIFYYMGTGRLFQEYGQNPYYTTVTEFMNTGVSDSILASTGFWSDSVVVYGPLWVLICGAFSFLSFGNATFLLYIYKIFALALHIATCYIVYKITNKKKFALMYGLNPFLLMEFLTNVHNDLYLLFFVMLAIYFLKKKNNIWLSLFCLISSILIKYVTVIFAPFFVLYYLRDKSKLKKVLWCVVYALIAIAIVLGIYMIFFNNISDLINILQSQNGKIKESIYLVMLFLGKENWIDTVKSIFIFVLAYEMILYIIFGFFKKEKFRDYMNDAKNILLILIFGVLTNFTAWYISWLFIPIYWLKSKDIKSILFMQFLFELSYAYLFFYHSDAIKYEVKIIPFVAMCMLIRFIIICVKQLKEEENCKKMKRLS